MLRQDTAACLSEALALAKEFVTVGQDTTAVAITSEEPRSLFIGHNYWLEQAAVFETQVAHTALERQNFGALVVPLLYRPDEGGGVFRSPRNPIQTGETNMLFCLSWHEREGFDIHRVLYTRRPNGEPVFDSTESLSGEVQLPATAPGAALVQSAIQHGGIS